MALESISSKNSISAYKEVAKQTAAKVSAPAPKPARPEENIERATKLAQTVVKTASETEDNAQESIMNSEEASRKMKSAIDKVNTKMAPTRTKCEFSYHEETKRVSIKVIDKDTEEVIREIPPEETLDMLTKMWEIAGLLVDEKR
ncbi:MAG: flagellar protein FlaG [Lachnospiraceae bacterium]|nr:flagellar protein FlaG [Lachnospiraceae bacterium]